MKLLIIESPGKQKTIQKYLGHDWKVIASLGHIRGLEQNLEFLKNDFEPKYEYLKEKAKAIKQLKEAATAAAPQDIYLGADKDYEGEQIAYSVCLLLKLNPSTANRVTFTEITEKAIKAAIEHPGRIDMDKVNTQKTRAILDMMIGFTMSPLLWRYVASSLSAGRCQTPALRLVVERENEITAFKVSSSWRLGAVFFKPSATTEPFKFSAQMENELEDEASAINYMEIVNSTSQAQIVSKNIREWTERAPLPLITSTLQQQASALYGSNPKATMKIAQRLYEAGHITYMRTDKAVISEDAVKEAQKWVEANYGEEYLARESNAKAEEPYTKEEDKEEDKDKDKEENKKKPKKKSKTATTVTPINVQEAHEAIRPTHMEVTSLEDDATQNWTAYDRKIYKLIWQRTIQSIMAAARGETCKVRIQIENDKDFTWSAQWKRTTFDGWKRAGKIAEIDEEEEEAVTGAVEAIPVDQWANATKMNIGDKVQWSTMTAEPKDSRSPTRFTEATLVRDLEKYGIGRPSTFASLLATIQEKQYVELKDIPAKEIVVKEYTTKSSVWPPQEKEQKKKVGAEKNKLVPTQLGYSVLNFMLKHFNDLFNYGFTAQMEKRLDRVAEGEEPWKEVLRDMWASYKDRYESLMSKATTTTAIASAKIRNFTTTTTAELKAVQTKKGPLLLIEGEKKEDTQFLGWPKGVAFDDMTEEIARRFQEEFAKNNSEQISEWRGQPIIKKTGKFGDYLKCSEVSIPYYPEEEIEKTMERLEAKANGLGGVGIIKKFKEYVIRKGRPEQGGDYIMKTSLKKPQFVSMPKNIDPQNLTEKDVEAIYKAGIESKKKWKSHDKK